jgi:hypothetical protein
MRTSFSTIAFAAADAASSNAGPATPAVAEKPAATAKPKRVAKPKPVAVETVAEAKPDPRVARAERIAADRANVSALYATFEASRVSVPVKALSAFKPLATTAHPIARNPSQRQAAAIATAFAASGLKLIDGKSAPRVFEINGVRSCIENGVLRDAVSSGLVTVSGDTPETETIKLAPKASAAIAGLIGAAAIKAGKLAA